MLEATCVELEDDEEGEEWWLPQSQHERRLVDHYILGEVIGRGPASAVYKVLLKGKTEWACKVFKKSALKRTKVVAEVAVLQKLRHPNLVQVREVLETPEELHVVEQLVTGGELLERLAGSGHYTETDAADALRQVLLALQHLHDNGVVHGDVRPENLLYEDDKKSSPLKLADFGLSKARPLAGFSSILQAPEVVTSKEFGPPADLWNLGVVMYIMLCGFEPFWEDSEDKGLYKQVLDKDVNFPSPWWDDISDSSKDLITRLLEKQPSQRPTAAETLCHPWVQGETCHWKHMGTTIQRLREFNARRKFRVATHAVLATHRALYLISPERKPGKVTIT